jgi:hypothetical protein
MTDGLPVDGRSPAVDAVAVLAATGHVRAHPHDGVAPDPEAGRADSQDAPIVVRQGVADDRDPQRLAHDDARAALRPMPGDEVALDAQPLET